MANSLKKLAGQTAIYGLSSIIGRFLNYMLVPLYTYKIAAASGGYGIVTNIYAYTALLLVLLTFGMETTFFYYANREDVDSRKAFSTAASAVGIVSLVFWLICMVFGNGIANLLHYEDHPEYIRVMATVVSFDAFQAILFARLRNENRALKFVTLKLSFIVSNILLNLFIFLVAPALQQSHPSLMSWYDPNYQVGYVFIVNLLCTSGVMLGFIPEIKGLRFGIDRALLKDMLRYTWPLLLLGLIGILNQVADKICYKFIVPGQEGEVQLGIYGACVKIAMIIAIFTQAFRYAYEPFVFGGQKEKNSKEMQADVMKYYVIFTLMAFLIVVLYMDIFKFIIKEDYWEGLRTVPIVMMAEIFMGIYFNLSFWYKLNKQTWWGAIFSAIGCAVMLAINFIFVPKYGYMACAWGGLAGYGICMLLSYVVGQIKSPIPYKLGLLLGYFSFAILLYEFSILFHPQKQIWVFVVNTVLMLVYVGVVVYNERELVRKVLNGVMHKS
ncbi:MAG: lipopolysaccharide biosynthesis protein [Bacteroidales bacterium]|nr:lipopolysaccharide biosynthesis protein [Bacteroidales bacterium]